MVVIENIIIYGAGAIGACIGGWLSSKIKNVYLLTRGENAQAMKKNGLKLIKNRQEMPEIIKVNVIEDISEIPSVDLILICVKNYDLEGVAKDIYDKLGDKPVIIGVQNGFFNREILPKYFSKVIYSVVLMSSWFEEPGVYGYNYKGKLVLGVNEQKMMPILDEVALLLGKGIEVEYGENINDIAHSKLVYNLGNALFALVDMKNVKESDLSKARKISARLILEGYDTIKNAGFQPLNVHELPSKKKVKISEKLPDKIGNKIFKDTLEKTWRNSMVQDIIISKKQKSELEFLNGYMLRLAKSNKFNTPYNETIYILAKKQFSKQPFEPLDINVVWEEIKANLNE